MAVTKSSSASSTPAAELKQPITVHFHVSILDPEYDLVNSFWFLDAAGLTLGVRRRIGIEDTTGLVERINEFGVDTIYAACDPSNRDRLIVSATRDDLEALAGASLED